MTSIWVTANAAEQQVNDEIAIFPNQLRRDGFDLEEFAEHVGRVDEELAKADERDMQEARIDVAHLTALPGIGEQSTELLEVWNNHLSREALLLATASLPELLENQLMVVRIFGVHLKK